MAGLQIFKHIKLTYGFIVTLRNTRKWELLARKESYRQHWNN